MGSASPPALAGRGDAVERAGTQAGAGRREMFTVLVPGRPCCAGDVYQIGCPRAELEINVRSLMAGAEREIAVDGQRVRLAVAEVE